jgi:hypothetical protein
VLWRRNGEGPPYEVLPEEHGDPGATLACADEEPGEAVVASDEPVVGEQAGWAPGFAFDAPGAATQTLEVPGAGWALSLQYHSQVPLTVSVDGEEVAELPSSLEGFYLTGAGRGAFWPVGELAAADGSVEVEVEAAEPSGLQDLLGVERKVWLGTVAAWPGVEDARLEEACGEYVDHYLPSS